LIDLKGTGQRRVQGWRDIERLVTTLKAIEKKQEAKTQRAA